MVLFENAHALNCRSETRSIFKRWFFGNPFLIGSIILAQGIHILAIYSPGLNQILGLQHISLVEWGSFILIASTLVVAMELLKRFSEK